jgi:hypothetical protein
MAIKEIKRLDDADQRFSKKAISWTTANVSIWIAVSAVLGLVVGGGAIYLQQSAVSNENLLAAQLNGRVALEEAELRALIRDNNIVAYWSGPEQNCKYALIVNGSGQAFIRYLKDGMGIDDSSSNYRVIGTYPQADSFSITKAAGNQANAISFVNPDGAQVFYSKEFPANVYLAFPDVNYQIEIFDPENGVSLSIATAAGAIRKVD